MRINAHFSIYFSKKAYIYIHKRIMLHIMNKEYLGRTIRERRKVLKVRQEDLAEISGVALRSIISIERGEGNPSLETLLKLTKVLGMEFQLTVKL